MRRLRSWMLLLLIPLLVSCSPSPRASVVTGCVDAQAACLQGLATVTMQTSQGEFTIEVNGDAAPLTSGNFIDLVRRGTCLLYTSPSPRDRQKSRMPSSA